LKSKQFLSKNGQRILFAIECINGKSISSYSYFKNTEKEIILMLASYFDVIGQLNPAPELHIIQLKEISPPITLVKLPCSTSSVVNKSYLFSHLLSKVTSKSTSSKIS